jgi:hypothetical protein
MTEVLDGSVIRMFRLVDGPDDLGLSCNPDGLFLAGVPLLRKTRAGFVPRPASEIAALIKAAYGAGGDQIRLQSSLSLIARALNSGDFALAAIAAVQTRTPELSREAAARLVNAEGELTKYNFNPDEPRDQHGRWTRDGSSDPASSAAPGIEGDQRVDLHASDRQQRVVENASAVPIDTAPLSENVGAVDVAIGDDIMRSIVKNACIAECSESSLPTYNYGWTFVKCVNDCMRRHGHNPFLFRLS